MSLGKYKLVWVLLVFCTSGWATEQETKTKARFLEIKVEGTPEALTDDAIDGLLTILQPRDMSLMQELIREQSIQVSDLSEAHQALVYQQGLAIKNEQQVLFWSGSKSPRYVLPVVSIDATRYLAVDVDDFMGSNFDRLIPLAILKEHPRWSHPDLSLNIVKRGEHEFALVSPLPLEAVILLMSDLCTSEWTSRTFAIRDLEVNLSPVIQTMTVDYSLFAPWRQCNFTW